MRELIVTRLNTTTIEAKMANIARLIAKSPVHGYVGIVEYTKDEGLYSFRVRWSNGNVTESFNDIEKFVNEMKDTNVKIYEI